MNLVWATFASSISRLAFPRQRTSAGLWVALALAGTAHAQTGSTLRVAVDSNGTPKGGYSGEISDDGHVVVFASTASDLVPGDTNDAQDVFVHDWTLGRTIRVSVDSAGNEGDLGSGSSNSFGSIDISADGRFTAFMSSATNFVPADTNGRADVFVHDGVTGQTTRVSVNSAGVQGNEHSGIDGVSISGDGRYVAFKSVATNLVPGLTSPSEQVYVHDRQTGLTTRVSVDSVGTPANGPTLYPDISADGRFVAFASLANNLVPGDGTSWDNFVHDRVTGITLRVNVDSSGNPANDQLLSRCRLSADGRLAVFGSTASNLVPNDTNGVIDTFVHDLVTGQTSRVNVSSSGIASNGGSLYAPAISADGRFVAFQDSGDNLVPGDTNGVTDVFVHDLQTGATSIVSLSTAGTQGNGASSNPSLSGDGRFVEFWTEATNLVHGGWSSWELLRDRLGCSTTIASYCTAGTTTHGCTPSMSGLGVPSASAGSGFTIQVTGVEGQKSGQVFFGLAGAQAVPFGGGSSLLCVRAPLQRTGVQSSGGTGGACDGALTLDWNQFVATSPGLQRLPLIGGETVWSQAWFRDPSAPGGSRLSNGLWFTVCP